MIQIVMLVTIIVLGFGISYLIWLAQINYRFIKQYKLLMNCLESITMMSSSMSVWGVTCMLRNSRNLNRDWITYSEDVGERNNNAFIALNVDLDVLIRAPYLLILNTPVYKVRRAFYDLVNENKEIYIKFIKMLNTKGIPVDAFDYSAFKTEHDAFYDMLKWATYRCDDHRCDDLKEDFPYEFFLFLSEEPKWQKTFVVC